MKIETLGCYGFEQAIHAMRNPMNSWAKSDSKWVDSESMFRSHPDYMIGPNDKELSIKLQKAGSEHCKHLRMIMVYADITAPFTWWKEFDTYRAGVEKVSCSTMHKLMSRDLTIEDFEPAISPYDSSENYDETLAGVIEHFNELREAFAESDNEVQKKFLWEYAIQTLPQSYVQTRTVMISYAALRNIVRQREGHKLKQWKMFIDWARRLPNSWMIFE